MIVPVNRNNLQLNEYIYFLNTTLPGNGIETGWK